MSRFVQQTNWARGEIEPTLEGRQEAEFYQSAAERLENWMPDTVSALRVRAPFESIFRLPQQVSHDGTTLSLRPSRQNLLGYVWRGAQVLVHLAVFGDGDGNNRLVARAYKVSLTRNETDSPSKMSSVVESGPVYVSDSFLDAPSNITYEVGFAVAGPAAFITHHKFPPLRVFPTSEDPKAALFEITEINWFQEVFGFATPESGTSNWVGDEDALFAEQLEIGDTVRFNNELYTVASTTVSTDEEDEGIHKFTTTETYTGPSITARLDVAKDDPFEGNPALVAFYQNRLVLANTTSQPTGVWLSRSNDPFTIIPSSVDEDSPINAEFLAEGADEFVWMTGGDRLYFGSGLGEYALGSPDETLSPVQLRFFRIGNNGGAKITPIVMDGSVVFCNRSRSQVLSVVYDLTRQSFSTSNLSMLSSHLTQNLVDLAFRPPVRNDRTPRVFALADGQLRAMALSEAASLAAWSRVAYSPAFDIVAIAGTSEYLFGIAVRASGAIDLAVLRNE